jgi:hypothetical protein
MKSCLRKIISFVTIWSYLFITPISFAHEGEVHYSDLEEKIGSLSFDTIILSTVILLILTVISLLVKKISPIQKKVLFISISAITIIQTFFLAASTVYINSISYSKGPVHFHADFEIYNCGEKVDLLDPSGLSNKIGTATLHEHNDLRIHLEGVVVEESDQSLGKFFFVIGGHIDSNSLSVPTNEGQLELTNGTTCPDNSTGTINVFVYKIVNGYYIQEKLKEPEHYIYTPYSQVPPGDCIIIEFGEEKDTTDKLCTSYKVAEKIGKIKNGGSLKDY